jgi:flagellar export protein FliJ
MSISRLFPLAAVLRVRRIQEDKARGDVATAHAALRQASSEYSHRQALLAGRPVPGSAESSVWLASIAANLASASDAFAARDVVAEREADAAGARDRWSQAAMAHQGIEHMAERHAERVRHEDEAAEQRAADDRAGGAHHQRSMARAKSVDS